MHEGHRQRMIERLITAENSLQEYELLEMLLFNAVPRKNTNEIAHELVTAFGNIKAIFKADAAALMKVKGVGESVAAYLRCIGLFMDKIIAIDSPKLPSAYTYESFSSYLLNHFKGATQEFLELYSVKKNGEMRFCQRLTSEESDNVHVSSSEILKFIANSIDSDVILVHNHLNHECYPSAEDDDFTKIVHIRCSVHDIRLLDHYIVCPDKVYSYFLHGKMQEIRNTYDIKKFMGTK